MSMIYDNWERLVDAVLDREHFLQLCLDNSSAYSTGTSSDSSFSSPLTYFPSPVPNIDARSSVSLLTSQSCFQPITVYDDVNEITERMVVAGYINECSHEYSTCRQDFLEESFFRLGLQKLSIDDLHRMHWTQLEDEIEKWIKAINVVLRILFPSNRRLCDRVFFGFSAASDLYFMEVFRGSTIQLLNFADALAIGSRAPERLFKVLDVYGTLRDLMPEFELIFSDQYFVSLRNEAITIWKRLREAIRGMFMELENLIRRDPAKDVVPGGWLHPITRYVVNYLRAACRARVTLEQVFEESGVDYRKGDDGASLLSSSSSSLAVQMARIMELLESNQETRSKVYRDSALCSVFMMNNGRYIVQKVKDNELGTLLGEDWIRKHSAKIRQYHMNYLRSSWSKVLGVLKLDSNSMSPNGKSLREISVLKLDDNLMSPNWKSLRKKLKLFNSYFEETCKTQSSWVIFDDQLRDELRISISGILPPAYQVFIVRSNSRKIADRYIRYSVEDIEARIGGLFLGKAEKKRPWSRRRKVTAEDWRPHLESIYEDL